MPGAYNPEDWTDLLGLIIIAVAFVGAASVPVWLQRRSSAKTDAKLDGIRSQVQNGHTEPLRADIDRIIAAQADLVAEQRAQRVEAREEHRQHRADIKDIRDDYGRRIDGLASKLDRHMKERDDRR